MNDAETRLNAAAPEILRVLTVALETLEDDIRWNEEYPPTLEKKKMLVEEIRATIAKATRE